MTSLTFPPSFVAVVRLPLLALQFFFFFFLLARARAPETSALFMGSRLQLHWRILHKGCTKSTAVASFGSSVYPSPLRLLSAVQPSRTFPPMWQLLPYILLLCPEVKFVILFTYVRIHTLCTSGLMKRRVSRTIFSRDMISAKSVCLSVVVAGTD